MLMGTTLLTVAKKSLFASVILSVAGLLFALASAPASAEGAGAGQVDHWGSYSGGGSTGENLRPESITLPGQVAEIGTSNSTEYALLTNGSLYSWGLGTHGELGNGTNQNSLGLPQQVSFPGGVQIAWIPTDVMPFDTALAVDTQGHVWGWGYNRNGELCLGNDRSYSTPVELPFTDVTALAGAGTHALYDANGTVYACGTDRDGELGDGGGGSSSTPVQVRNLNGRSVTSLVAAYANSGALLSNGEYLDWGYDGQGQLGDGTINQSSDVPVEVPLPQPVTRVVQGGSLFGNGQTLVMLSDGSLFAWGDGKDYQLGNGKSGVAASPVRFFPPRGVTYTALATNGNTSYATSSDGDVYAWGAGGSGQVGDGNKGVAKEPVWVDSGASAISATADDVAVNNG
jgi:alpha-tubulin suppressor-like RCC1 family protein